VDLHFVKDKSDLAGKVRRAERWFHGTIAAIDLNSLEQRLNED
jgi:hypothetical protein